MPGCLPHFLLSWVKWGRKEGKSGGGGGETVLALLGLETFLFLLPVGLPCLSLYFQQCPPCEHCCCGGCLSFVSCRVRSQRRCIVEFLIFVAYSLDASPLSDFSFVSLIWFKSVNLIQLGPYEIRLNFYLNSVLSIFI